MTPGALAIHLWQSTIFAVLCAAAALSLTTLRAARVPEPAPAT